MLGSTNSGDKKKKNIPPTQDFPSAAITSCRFCRSSMSSSGQSSCDSSCVNLWESQCFFSPGICTWETFSTWVYIHSVWWIFCMSWDMGEGFSSVGVILANIWHCCKPLHHRFRSWCLSCRQIKTKWIIQSRIFANRCGTSYKSPQTWENQK